LEASFGYYLPVLTEHIILTYQISKHLNVKKDTIKKII
jgi:hypothetical protein